MCGVPYIPMRTSVGAHFGRPPAFGCSPGRPRALARSRVRSGSLRPMHQRSLMRVVFFVALMIGLSSAQQFDSVASSRGYLRLTTGTQSYDDGRDVYVTLTSASGTVKASYVAIDTPPKGGSTYWRPSGASFEQGDRLRLQYTSGDGWAGTMHLDGVRLMGITGRFEMDSPCCTDRTWTLEFPSPPRPPPPPSDGSGSGGGSGGGELGVILGIAGGVVFLLALALIIALYRLKKKPPAPPPAQPNMMPQAQSQIEMGAINPAVVAVAQPTIASYPTTSNLTLASAPRFDINTGQPIPKFDPETGKQNWA